MHRHTGRAARIRPRPMVAALATALLFVGTACQETPLAPEDGARARPGMDQLSPDKLIAAADAAAEPGTGQFNSPLQAVIQSLSAAVTEIGKVSLSVDGGGSTGPSYTVDVEKPAGATVKGAYFMAASTGFTNFVIPNGGVSLGGTPVNWDMSLPSSISSHNFWADVTAIVKPVVDAAAAGTVTFTVDEANSGGVDGTVLAVIFDDPNQAQDNTVVLMFGAQNIAGDDFFVNTQSPLDPTDPSLVVDMGLGISFGAQPSGQVSLVDVNGSRLSSCAGGEDDGQHANGALLTVGGLGDSNANPANPNQVGCDVRDDDEMYNLLPFVSQGDTQIHVHTVNPSNDDNIFFAWFFMTVKGSVTPQPNAIVIDILPAQPNNPVNPKSKGRLPVAILSSASFDATTVDPETATLGNDDGNDARSWRRPDGTIAYVIYDFNGDGLDDMLVYFSIPWMVELGDLTNQTTDLTLNALTRDGTPIKASDFIRI